ncbi:type I-F CRISPR-associated protein Csy1 [Aeromonas cavernicola]|uniref:Type I-F CRISPR-associated protein Csy1 n=1 Tax=Aeromonas cavernicola TaxID=1006623 RepID=A0A2H9U0N9_9GAMM|nr:type I-F CRISPR-associated protein Csy1 [Aeromonas cavernicola]PJG57570.1 type I-F CRISPR-associated protein Csy1 [Aeromonas cavernicola]
MSEHSLSSAIDDYISGRQAAKPDKWPTKADWLDDAAKRAKQITLVTHAPKFTHGDAKGVGAWVAGKEREERGEGGTNEKRATYLSTSSLTAPAIDVIGNAAALDVANLLLLEADGKRLVDRIQHGDTAPLSPFTKEPEQLDAWCDGLSQALTGGEVISHSLAKQSYFPLDQGYHLLSPLFASALCHALHQRIDQARFSDEAKATREARRKNDFSAQADVYFPNLAQQHFGGTKPQNVSLLNSKRYGRAYLLSCQPPSWQAGLTVPQSEEHFWRHYGYRVRATTRKLVDFLRSVGEVANNHEIKQARAKLVGRLRGELHRYAKELRTLPAGWSHHLASPLDQSFCYWLDRGCPTAPAQWGDGIGMAFGRWLNKQLQPQLTHVGDIDLRVWARELAQELRLLQLDWEA